MTHGTYDPALVALSVVIATFASYTALELARSVGLARGRMRLGWLGGGSAAMGAGIWSMHFIGMLAFSVPGMAIAYDTPLLILSVLVAIAASSIALYACSRTETSPSGVALAGLFMAAAICGMHYIGIAGMKMPATVRWNWTLVGVSIVVALAASFAALWLACLFGRRPSRGRTWLKVASACVMGAAIAGMHYTAMAAMSFEPLANATTLHGRDVLASTGLATAVASATVIILGVALTGSVMQRELQRRSTLAEENARRFYEAEERAREEEALRRATELAMTALTSDELLQQITTTARDATSADIAYVERIDESHQEVTVAASSAPERLLSRQRAPHDGSMSQKLAAAGTSIITTSMPAHHPLLARALGSGREAFVIAVPLAREAAVIGTLVLLRDAGKRPFRPDEATRASTFAHLAALAFQRVSLVEDANRRRQELDQAERLAALGRLASTMAHEFNNVLMAIQTFTEISRRAGSYDRYLEIAPKIERAVLQGKRLTEDVLRLSRPAKARMEPVDLCAWLNAIRAGLNSTIAAEAEARRRIIELDIDLRDCPLHVWAAAEQLRDVLIHLTRNASEAMPDGGQIVITAERAPSSPSASTAQASNDLVRLTVRDTGTGMEPDIVERAFEPLFSTKTHARGLGLAISHDVIRSHGGSIGIDSNPGAGSTVEILLRSAPPPVDVPERSPAAPPTATRRILLVEDDDAVAEGLTMMLELSGLEVRRVARGGEAAPAIAEAPPDVVILDVGLPDLDGVSVYRLIETSWPSLPVVFATGHADETLLESMHGRPHIRLLRKPFEIDELLQTIELVVAAAGTAAEQP